MLSSGSMYSRDKMPIQDEYDNSIEGVPNFNKKIVKLGESNELTYKDLILLIKTSFSVVKWPLVW